MKKMIGLLAISALLAGCAHQVGIFGLGTGFRAGGGEYGINYGEGFFGTLVTRGGIKFKVELDSTTGFSYDPTSNTYKGIRSIEYSIQPQLDGYAVKLSKDNPEVAKAYYGALVKYYEMNTPKSPQISDEKSKSATESITDVIKKAVEKAKEKSGKGEATSDDWPFKCDGDCELTNLDSIGLREFQTAVAEKLLTYADEATPIHDSDATVKATLDQFLSRMQQYADKDISSVGLRVRRATIKSGILQDVTYVFIDGSSETETNCPECIFIKELDYKGEE